MQKTRDRIDLLAVDHPDILFSYFALNFKKTELKMSALFLAKGAPASTKMANA